MLDILLDTLIDGIKLLPFLFVAFFIIEYIEHRYQDKSLDIVKKTGRFGPLVGGILGLVPQCGFSVLATNLYVTRIVSLGTLISIYLATSDEMIPVMLAGKMDFKTILIALLIKLVVGMLCGFIIDLILHKNNKPIYDICEDEHCLCEKTSNIFLSSLTHTLKIFGFILLISLVLNISFEYLGNNFLSKILLKDNLFGSFLTSLIGLIPNCGASVLLTNLYISNAINFGEMMAGLLTGSGIAIVVLFRSNKHIKENLLITLILYLIGSIVGLLINLF